MHSKNKPLKVSTFNECIELELLLSEKKSYKAGSIYTLYRTIDNTVKIGYTSNLESSARESNGYKLIGIRSGSLREKRLLVATLVEMGFRSKNGNDVFNLSKELIRSLKILGWPQPESIRKKRSNY